MQSTANNSGSITSENPAENLEKILTNETIVKSGQVKLLGLDQLKSKLGEKWPSLLDKVHGYLISILNKHLGSKDVYFNKSDEEFIIVFASTDEYVAKFVASKILEELTEKFLGEVETEDIIVKTAIQDIHGDLLFVRNDFKALIEQFKEDKKYEKRSPETFKKDQIEQSRYIFVYRPLWNVGKEVITTYSSNSASYVDENNNDLVIPKKFGYDVLGVKIPRKAMTNLDRVMLSSAIKELKKMGENKSFSIINISISYESVFTVDLLMQYAAICERIPEDLKKYISFTLVKLPEGVPTNKLQFIVATLKKSGSSVTLLSQTLDIKPENYKYIGFDTIGFDLPVKQERLNKTWEKLPPFIEKCHSAKLKVMLFKVDNLESLTLAKTNKADFVSGSAIGDYIAAPQPMKRAPWNNLLSKLSP